MYDYLRCRPVAVLMYIKNRIVNSLNADSQQTRCGGLKLTNEFSIDVKTSRF